MSVQVYIFGKEITRRIYLWPRIFYSFLKEIWYDKHDLMMENITAAPPKSCTQFETHGQNYHYLSDHHLENKRRQFWFYCHMLSGNGQARPYIWSSGCRPCRYPLRYKYGSASGNVQVCTHQMF